MFLEVKQGDRVWEDYNRDRSGIVQKVFEGKKGAIYCEVLWDAVPNVLGEMGQPTLAPKINARSLRSSRNPKFMTAAELATLEAERIAALPPPPAYQSYEMTVEERNFIVAALKGWPCGPQVRHKIGLLLARLEK